MISPVASTSLQEEQNFLRWLGGYFDHGGCCKVYHSIYKVRGKLYSNLDVNVQLVGKRQIMEYVKAHYHRWNAKLVPMGGKKQTWRFIIRDRAEALVFCQDLLSYSKFRTKDLENMIQTIKREI